MEETAIPISKTALLKAVRTLKEKPEEALDKQQDNYLASLQEEKGWQILKKRIETRIKELQELSEAIEGTESIETIGFKFLASRIAIYHLQGVINDVEQTKKYVEEQKQAE